MGCQTAASQTIVENLLIQPLFETHFSMVNYEASDGYFDEQPND